MNLENNHPEFCNKVENSSAKNILKEILPVPSEKVLKDRFNASEDSKAADCNGNCASPGGCRGLES